MISVMKCNGNIRNLNIRRRYFKSLVLRERKGYKLTKNAKDDYLQLDEIHIKNVL